jgi:NAD(P)-dependent dehydrogenase (short-subunit alcohol dehydrogenase family)
VTRSNAAFEGKVALVTGGASGIGRATALSLAQRGATVLVADVDVVGGKAVAAQLGTELIELDVSDPDAWTDAIARVVQSHAGLDILHLNAGIATFKGSGEEFATAFDLEAMPIESYRRIMGINVDGVAFGIRAALSALAEGDGGSIVATASAAGVIAFAADPIYTATKHAVVGLVRSMAPVLAPRAITCNAILPGAVDTAILAEGFADKAREMGIPVGMPEEIADGVLGAIEGGGTGQLWLCLAGQAPCLYDFAPVPGLGIPD